MKRCENCNHGDWVRNNEYRANKLVCNLCRYVDENGMRVPSNWKPIVNNNADRIRAMSDEELAEFLRCPREFENPAPVCFAVRCNECVAIWLKQPVKDGE